MKLQNGILQDAELYHYRVQPHRVSNMKAGHQSGRIMTLDLQKMLAGLSKMKLLGSGVARSLPWQWVHWFCSVRFSCLCSEAQ